jgi:hypothetical protein
MDFLVDAALFILGGAGGYLAGYVRRPLVAVQTAVPQVVERVIAQAFGRDGVYVRFTRADGSVRVRKFRPADLGPEIEFCGVTYAAGEWTSDGHVYNEIV